MHKFYMIIERWNGEVNLRVFCWVLVKFFIFLILLFTVNKDVCDGNGGEYRERREKRRGQRKKG